ncbi:hypothetical protein [Xanthocytophaga agilis]|uniref:Uncharacterized protein n=1 Tax=Xanthocytophaga agilis TaxID=3048010 RepID=A0AAE3UIE3_9BACT|nr:hypothetical protein [Xanthocytophaga agilis]MDJ1503613.1 hypothetical protein [Xanthocytophaga agilis]
MRWCTIVETQQISDILYFEYTLGKIVKYDVSPQATTDKIQKFNFELTHHHGTTLHENLLVFYTNISFDVDETGYSELQAWGRLINTISFTIPALQGQEFLKISEISTLNKTKEIVKDGYFQLKPNKLYNLFIFQVVPNPSIDPPPSHFIEISAPEEHLTILKKAEVIVGKYDILRFIFRSRDISVKENSFIDIRVNTIDANKTNFPLPPIHLPIQIRNQLNLTNVTRLVVGVASVVTILFNKVLFTNVMEISEQYQQLAYNISIVLFTLTIADKYSFLKLLKPNIKS